MSGAFLDLISMDEARGRLETFAPFAGNEMLELEQAMGRVLSRPMVAAEALPAFSRSLMDGFAVRAADLASARETAPVVLRLVGQISMGRAAEGRLDAGQAMSIPTGAMLPEGADAVLMIEHSRPMGLEAIEACRAVGAGDNVLRRGDDLDEGTSILPAGRRLTPLDLGVLAACGILRVPVFLPPKVAILSTGDELVDIAARPGPGQVRDTNAMTLAAQVVAAGGRALITERVPDQAELLAAATRRALEQADMILLSGGSSVGVRDHTAKVLGDLAGGQLLIEGIALSPGKPTLLADLAGTPAFGMPGHPISSFVVFHVLVAPLLRRLGGESPLAPPRRLPARLTENVESAPGRETWVRVRLQPDAQGWTAQPVPGGSAVYRSLAHSDGLLGLPSGLEGVAAGEEVEVEVLR